MYMNVCTYTCIYMYMHMYMYSALVVFTPKFLQLSENGGTYAVPISFSVFICLQNELDAVTRVNWGLGLCNEETRPGG